MNLIEAKFVINLAEDSLKLVTANIAFRPFDIGTFRQNFTWKVYSEDDRYPTFNKDSQDEHTKD